jgi:hypothetical protein
VLIEQFLGCGDEPLFHVHLGFSVPGHDHYVKRTFYISRAIDANAWRLVTWLAAAFDA